MTKQIGRIGPVRATRKSRIPEPLAGGCAVGVESGTDVAVEESLEITLAELREFLDADRLEVRANPAFKERLRDKLWALVQARSRRFRGERP